MKKIAAFIFLCVSTLSSGMNTDRNDVQSKINKAYKTYCKNLLLLGRPTLSETNHVTKFTFTSFLFKQTFDYDPLSGNPCKPIYENFFPSLVIRHHRSNKDYQDLDTILKFISSENKSIYEELRKEKKHHSFCSDIPKYYSHYNDKIGTLGIVAFGLLSGIGGGYVCKKFLGESNLSAITKGISILSGATSKLLMRKLLCTVVSSLYYDENGLLKLNLPESPLRSSIEGGPTAVSNTYRESPLLLEFLIGGGLIGYSLWGKKLSLGASFFTGLLGANVLDRKFFHPYEKKLYTKKAYNDYNNKMEYEKVKKQLESLEYTTYKMHKKANLMAHHLKPIFQKSIREKENDKLNLIDITIKTLN